MKPARPIAVYENFATEPVLGLPSGARVRTWKAVWLTLFEAMAQQGAVFEVASLVIARWEFLGGLFSGTEEDTDFEDALAYCRRFLVPHNGNYATVDKVVDRRDARERFDLFTMLRNKPLHGVVPAAIATEDGEHVVTWWMGFTGVEPKNHMKVDDNGGLHVNVTILCEDLGKSMEDFAIYLDANTEQIGGQFPQDRWQRGFWARFRPQFMARHAWMALGVARGVSSRKRVDTAPGLLNRQRGSTKW